MTRVPSFVKTVARKMPGIRGLVAQRDQLQAELEAYRQNNPIDPPGHFYSPVHSVAEIKKDEALIFGGPRPRTFPAIDMNEAGQLEQLEKFVPFYSEIPFKGEKQNGLRYYFDNLNYGYSDAIMLYSMIRYLKPKRIIEIGSGFSSCVILDTNEQFFGGAIKVTCIEPYPELLLSLIKSSDKKTLQIIPTRLQEVDLNIFSELQANDILFIDSTHVSKINSDVNRIFFHILPGLCSGVHIHFHDIFDGFEYPKDWVYTGRAWNEAYMLRTFLEYNQAFRILVMNDFIAHHFEPFLRENMPLCLKNTGGSIWLRKE